MKQGILLVDKPEDWTSFDAVNYVRKIVASKERVKPRQIKLGHSGTLDPFATGLLILLVGKDYTRRANEFSKKDKTYIFELLLGKASTTGDKTGVISDVSDRVPSLDEVKTAISKFIGSIEQTPPAFSAIKVNGVRAYKLARKGLQSEIAPRKIKVHSLELLGYSYPKVNLKADVSSGTYIRSLGEDIGETLGTGAFVESLRRESVGEYKVVSAANLQNLDKTNVEQFIESVRENQNK